MAIRLFSRWGAWRVGRGPRTEGGPRQRWAMSPSRIAWRAATWLPPPPGDGYAVSRPKGHAPVAQRIEHLTTDQKVGGSSPSGRALHVQASAANPFAPPSTHPRRRKTSCAPTETHELSPPNAVHARLGPTFPSGARSGSGEVRRDPGSQPD